MCQAALSPVDVWRHDLDFARHANATLRLFSEHIRCRSCGKEDGQYYWNCGDCNTANHVFVSFTSIRDIYSMLIKLNQCSECVQDGESDLLHHDINHVFIFSNMSKHCRRLDRKAGTCTACFKRMTGLAALTYRNLSYQGHSFFPYCDDLIYLV